MLIKICTTPNPNSLKFLVGYRWLEFIWECKTYKDAAKSILAQKLWEIEGVEYMLFGYDFVAITKKPDAIWEILQPGIVEHISEFVIEENGLFVDKKDKEFDKKDQNETNTETNKEYSELEQKMIEVLRQKVQPAIDSHGGLIKFIEFDCNGIVWLDMQGACKGCPSSTITLKNGIENLMKYYFPEIKSIENIEDRKQEDQDQNQKTQNENKKESCEDDVVNWCE